MPTPKERCAHTHYLLTTTGRRYSTGANHIKCGMPHLKHKQRMQARTAESGATLANLKGATRAAHLPPLAIAQRSGLGPCRPA